LGTSSKWVSVDRLLFVCVFILPIIVFRQGFAALEMLNILEGFNLTEMGFLSAGSSRNVHCEAVF
jgi:hypothetical protein